MTPAIISKQYPAKTFQEAVEMRSDTFATMVKTNSGQYGLEKAKEKVEAVIRIHLADFIQSLNLKRTMTERDIDECAEMIRSNFYYLQIHHLPFIFREAKMGNYFKDDGGFYEAISTTKIIAYITEFADKLLSAKAEKSINEHKDRKLKDLETGGKDILGGTNQKMADIFKSVVKTKEPELNLKVEIDEEKEKQYFDYTRDPKIEEFKKQLQEMEKAKVPVEELEAMQQNFLLYIKTTYPRLA